MEWFNPLPCALSAKEAAAINRRRQVEEERRARIFNPRVRTLGVDVSALDQQVAERRAKEERERCRDLQHDRERLYLTAIATKLDEETRNLRHQISKDVDSYRKSYQKAETRREYDLYDPEGLKKDSPARVKDDDEKCGPSSAQKFLGEDLQRPARLSGQQGQQRAWLQQQMLERRIAEEDRARAEREMAAALLAQEQRASALQREEELSRQELLRATRNCNRALAVEQTAQRQLREARDREDARREQFNLMTGDLLTENPATAISAFGPHRLIPDRWKGMSEEQVHHIRREQLKQAEENKVKRELEAKKQRDWENYLLRCDAEASSAQLELQEKQRQLNEQTARYNAALSTQQLAQRRHIERVVFANQATEQYFGKFNVSSR